ncbi:Protein of unknown function (DUF2971) [Jejuia pallidilutea]|uniref:DUF2971 domain-containing protein n=1 Tax=Jejuia pallidilutea TaxID=504487 RepID=A0A362X392_9FLAO|nr:DUF2971 domain-containing protein [Jejuia pallidilutea]PQV51217.1 Protein of unknown function (DUF2971) [Jejuia pallidilutea]
MSWSEVYRGSLEDIDFPEVVYKYRDWEYPYHDRFIKEREVFMASPNSFEDEKDCRNPIRYDLLTEKQTIQFYEHISRREYPDRSRQQHRKEARIWANKRLFKDSEKLEEYRNYYNKEHDLRQGVLSLTAEPCLLEMWNKYSNYGKGFCIGYNSKIMFKFLGGGAKVNYYDELPIILPKPFMNYYQKSHYQIFCKERKWEFEREYRTISFWENPASISERQITLPKEAFNKIILGKNIAEKHRIEITNAVKDNIGEIPIVDYESVCSV